MLVLIQINQIINNSVIKTIKSQIFYEKNYVLIRLRNLNTSP